LGWKYTHMSLKKCNNLGFALFEVLIALVVMAVSMIGIASMLLLSHKANSSSYLKQQAIQAIYNIFDTIRSDSQAASAGSYNINNIVASGTPVIPSAPSPNCSTAMCTSTQLAAYNTWYWLSQDLAKLPSGCGSITTAANGSNTLVTVTVQWDDSPAQKLVGATSNLPLNSNANLVQLVMVTLL
jgi:type IV pilus assembly protein PilV